MTLPFPLNLPLDSCHMHPYQYQHPLYAHLDPIRLSLQAQDARVARAIWTDNLRAYASNMGLVRDANIIGTPRSGRAGMARHGHQELRCATCTACGRPQSAWGETLRGLVHPIRNADGRYPTVFPQPLTIQALMGLGPDALNGVLEHYGIQADKDLLEDALMIGNLTRRLGMVDVLLLTILEAVGARSSTVNYSGDKGDQNAPSIRSGIGVGGKSNNKSDASRFEAVRVERRVTHDRFMKNAENLVQRTFDQIFGGSPPNSTYWTGGSPRQERGRQPEIYERKLAKDWRERILNAILRDGNGEQDYHVPRRHSRDDSCSAGLGQERRCSCCREADVHVQPANRAISDLKWCFEGSLRPQNPYERVRESGNCIINHTVPSRDGVFNDLSVRDLHPQLWDGRAWRTGHPFTCRQNFCGMPFIRERRSRGNTLY